MVALVALPLQPGALHLGPLHEGEHALVYLLAFGPFVLLALTIWLSRRRNSRDTPGGARLGSGHERDHADRTAPDR